MIFGEKSLPGKWSILTGAIRMCSIAGAIRHQSNYIYFLSLSVQTRAYLIRPSNVCKLNERGTANWMAFAYTGTSPDAQWKLFTELGVCSTNSLTTCSHCKTPRTVQAASRVASNFSWRISASIQVYSESEFQIWIRMRSSGIRLHWRLSRHCWVTLRTVSYDDRTIRKTNRILKERAKSKELAIPSRYDELQLARENVKLALFTVIVNKQERSREKQTRMHKQCA